VFSHLRPWWFQARCRHEVTKSGKVTTTIQPLRVTGQILSNPDFLAVFCISLFGLLGAFALILSGTEPTTLWGS
jgi:hypothetical protein